MAIPNRLTPRQFAASELFEKINCAVRDIDFQAENWHGLTKRERLLVASASRKLMKDKMKELCDIAKIIHSIDWVENGY